MVLAIRMFMTFKLSSICQPLAIRAEDHRAGPDTGIRLHLFTIEHDKSLFSIRCNISKAPVIRAETEFIQVDVLIQFIATPSRITN